MGAKIISFSEAIKKRENSIREGDFQNLFAHARTLRSFIAEETDSGLTVVSMENMKSWFQRELADEVFRKKLFSRSILSSVWFVSDLLTSFLHTSHNDASCVTDHMHAYEQDGNPEHVLAAANTAFLLFVFWPEYRPRRAVHYRKFAVGIGPSLYTNYAYSTGRAFGLHMADAFQPLGEIARDRFKHTM